jgi:hypothetical protein
MRGRNAAGAQSDNAVADKIRCTSTSERIRPRTTACVFAIYAERYRARKRCSNVFHGRVLNVIHYSLVRSEPDPIRSDPRARGYSCGAASCSRRLILIA